MTWHPNHSPTMVNDMEKKITQEKEKTWFKEGFIGIRVSRKPQIHDARLLAFAGDLVADTQLVQPT